MRLPLFLLLLASMAQTAWSVNWTLLYEEKFDADLGVDDKAWDRDMPGPDSPWEAGPLDDDGKYHQISGGDDFKKHLDSFHIWRKRVSFGDKHWLTAELAARGPAGSDSPAQAPSLARVKHKSGYAARLRVPLHDGGAIIRSTKPLPRRYRIEVELLDIDFDEYAGKEPKTIHPWTWGAGSVFKDPYEKWPTSREANGFYYLAIVDYPEPAPHNNVFIHTHRKVVMDSYNTGPDRTRVCHPRKEEFIQSGNHSVNMVFLVPGRKLESYMISESECGSSFFDMKTGSTIGAADRLVPGRPYRFAVERDGRSYVLEMSGKFKFGGRRTYRYRRDFIKDGRPIWHFNNAPEEYDGSFNRKQQYTGPFGSYEADDWPAGSAYPDYFILGDPHINYYEGSALIGALRLWVPTSDKD